MFATPLERAVRRQVRARLRSSELLWREYLPRRRIERWHLAGRLLLVLLTPLMLAVAIFALYMAAVVQLGIGLVEKEGPLVGTDNGPLLPLAFNSIIFTGATLLGISELRSALTRSKNLARCAYFPVADANFRRERVMKTAGYWLYALFTAPVFIWLARGHELSVFSWLIVVSMAVSQGLVCVAWVIACVGYSPKPWSTDWLSFAGLLLLVGGLFLSFGGAHLRAYERPISWAAFLLLPGGWVNGAFHYGLLEDHPAAWLLLVPAMVLLAAAWRWLHSPYTAIEFVFDAPCEAEAIFAPATLRKPPRSRWAEPRRPSAAADFPATAPAGEGLESPQAITERSLLAPLNWSRHNWLERFALRRLTDRQWMFIEFRTGESSPLRFGWYVYASAGCFIAAACSPLLAKPEIEIVVKGLTIAGLPEAMFSLFGFLGLMLATVDLDTLKGRASTAAWEDYHPVGFRELVATSVRIAFWRMMAIAPLALAAIVARYWLGGADWYWAALGLIDAGVLVATEHRLGALNKISLRIDGRARWRMDPLWFVCQTLVACGFVALVFVVSPMWDSLIALVAAFAAWLVEHYYSRTFDRGDFDIVR